LLCFIALNRALSCLVRFEETGVSTDVVFVDLTDSQYIFEQDIRTAQKNASVIAYYGSEEAILKGAHLQWFISYEYHYYGYDDYGYYFDYYTYDMPPPTPPPFPDNDYFDYNYQYDYDFWSSRHYEVNKIYMLKTTDEYMHYVTIDANVYNNADARRIYEERAINQQLREFRDALGAINNSDGLLFYIFADSSRDSNEYVLTSNVTGGQETRSFFTSQKVFYVNDLDYPYDSSFNSRYYIDYYYFWPGAFINNEDTIIYLALSAEFYDKQTSVFLAAQHAYSIDLGIIIICLVLIVISIVVLLILAGRQTLLVDGQMVRSKEVHFTPLDKIYLDISLTALALWTVALFAITYHTVFDISYWRWTGAAVNVTTINVLFALFTLLVVPPVLLWIISFTKRVKAGRFWRHTLVYALTFGLIRLIIRKCKSLWAGTTLTFKVSMISIVSFLSMIIVTWFTIATNSPLALLFMSLLVTSVVTLLLMLYARRLRNLELGAKAASEGRYDVSLNVGSGELGNIAQSLINISTGINVAVEERMKSERLKTELITNVSHDIRTPLTSIITYTDLLEHEGLNCKKAPEYLSILKQKALRLKTLTDELFEAAKASSGNIDVNPADLNIVSLINQVLGELDNTISASDLDLKINMPDKLIAVADGKLMHRVIENLMSNVFKYSLPGSRVYLDVLASAYNEIRIDIKNISSTSLNIDPAELIERFKRGDNSRTDGGSGLGLSIVQSFINAQGGRFEIKIDGDLFKATVFLPVPPPVHDII